MHGQKLNNGSVVSAEYLNTIQSEIENVIKAEQIPLDPGSYDQLNRAIDHKVSNLAGTVSTNTQTMNAGFTGLQNQINDLKDFDTWAQGTFQTLIQDAQAQQQSFNSLYTSVSNNAQTFFSSLPQLQVKKTWAYAIELVDGTRCILVDNVNTDGITAVSLSNVTSGGASAIVTKTAFTTHLNHLLITGVDAHQISQNIPFLTDWYNYPIQVVISR